VLGFLDPDYFLGGRTTLDVEASQVAVRRDIAKPLGLDEHEAAAAIVRLATERMVGAIEEITIHEGIDPTAAVLVGGGGAAGFNTVAIGRRLGCPEVIVPALGPALSAAGALISDLSRNFEIAARASDADFDFERINEVLAELERRAQEFIDSAGAGAVESHVEFSVEARYPHQVWELEVPLRVSRLLGADDLAALCADFHTTHRDVFAIADEASNIELQSWHARARCRLTNIAQPASTVTDTPPRVREIYLPDVGLVRADVWRLEAVPINEALFGPAIVETPTTTVVIDVGATFCRRPSGTLHIVPRVGGIEDTPVASSLSATTKE
jgi:N-methylhydantoinase A